MKETTISFLKSPKRSLFLFGMLTITLLNLPHLGDCKGKTYDDLDDILRSKAEGKLAPRENHHSYQVPVGEGVKIDPKTVVHKHKVEEERGQLLPTGYVITKAHDANKVRIFCFVNLSCIIC